MKKKKSLNPKKVTLELKKGAIKRKGIRKALSNRFNLEFNKKFLDVCSQFIKKYLSKKMNNVADIGIGTGRLANLFSKNSRNIVGVDFSDKMLSVAHKHLDKKKNVTLIYNNAVEIDFLPKYFDLGIVSLMLKHNNNKHTGLIINKIKKWCKQVLLIEHVLGGTHGSHISIMRDESWYLKQFKPMKPIIFERFKRGKDNIILCILK